MAKQEAFRKVDSERSRSWVIPSLVGVAGLVCMAGGANALWHHASDGPRPYRAGSAVILVMLGLVQGRMAQDLFRRPLPKRLSPTACGAFAAWMFVGLGACYAAALALGPDSAARYPFRAALAAWFTAAVAVYAGQPMIVRWQQTWLAHPITRTAGWGVLYVLVMLVMLEAGLRVSEDWRLSFSRDSYPVGVLPSAMFSEDLLASALYTGPFRVAALGHDVRLADHAATNCLLEVQQHLPGTEMYSFVHPGSRLRDYAPQLVRDIVPYDPDLVLVFVTVGEDLVPRSLPPGQYDWRSLRFVELACHYWWNARSPAPQRFDPPMTADDYESYLHAAAPQLAVCRTPIDTNMQQHWQRVFKHLDALSEVCRQRQMQLGIVLVPTEFQVDPSLCEVLRRRTGYGPEQLDVDLPQRRMAKFAQEHSVPLVDLLPYFRGSKTSPFGRHTACLSPAGHGIMRDVVSGWLESRFGPMIAAAPETAVTAK